MWLHATITAGRTSAILLALVTCNLSVAESESKIVIDVSRDNVISTVEDPQQMSEVILRMARYSQPSSQKDPVEYWDTAFAGPNWIYVQFVPALKMRINGGKGVRATTVSEILLSFPTDQRGRRWPDFMLLKTNVGLLSQASWSPCDVRQIVQAVRFDPATEAFPFTTYCTEH